MNSIGILSNQLMMRNGFRRLTGAGTITDKTIAVIYPVGTTEFTADLVSPPEGSDTSISLTINRDEVIDFSLFKNVVQVSGDAIYGFGD